MPSNESTAFAVDELRIFSSLRKAGFQPEVIFDIGAGNGAWSATVSQVFPDSRYHLFEPLAEIRDDYRKPLSYWMGIHPSFVLHPIALGSSEESVAMHTDASGYGSTILDIGVHPAFQNRVDVAQYPLDEYVRSKGIDPPDILKLDTQGAERLILSQAQKCLEYAKIVFAETWFIRGYGPQTPLLSEIVEILSAADFIMAELGHRFYDEIHGLYSCDAFFLKRDFLKSVAPAMPSGIW